MSGNPSENENENENEQTTTAAPDLPLASRVADFWGGAVPTAPDTPSPGPDPAIARLTAPHLAIRGRNPADLVRPAYDALTSR